MEVPDGEVPGLAVRGRPLLPLNPPLSLRLSKPLSGSDLGVARLARGVPELLRRSSKSPAGDRAGDAALEGTCHQQQHCFSLCSLLCKQLCKRLLAILVVFLRDTPARLQATQREIKCQPQRTSTVCRRPLLYAVHTLAWNMPNRVVGCELNPNVCPVRQTLLLATLGMAY